MVPATHVPPRTLVDCKWWCYGLFAEGWYVGLSKAAFKDPPPEGLFAVQVVATAFPHSLQPEAVHSQNDLQNSPWCIFQL